MAITATYPKLSHDWLKHETDPAISRDVGTIKAAAGKLESGTLLGRITATKKLVPCSLAANDGSEVPAALLKDYTDASGNADVKAVIIVGFAEVVMAELTFHASFDTLQKKRDAMAVLAAAHIKTRSIA